MTRAKLDVTDRASAAITVSAADRRFGSIDVLVNSAGYGYTATIWEDEDDASRTCSLLIPSAPWP